MSTHDERWWPRILIAGSLALAACSLSSGAPSTDELGGESGKYAAEISAPDNLTTTKQGATLKVTSGSAQPDRLFDRGRVQLTSKSGPTATFSSRSTGWGCTYTVHGVYVGLGSGIATWTNTFEEENNPRIALEVNGNGEQDNCVACSGGGTLTVTVLGGASSNSYTITLSDSPSGSPGGDVDLSSTSVTVAGDGGSATVSLSGRSAGYVTINATSSTISSASTQVVVISLTSQTVATIPCDMNRTKLGVGEEVILTLQPSTVNAMWALSGEGQLNAELGNGITFTAYDRASAPAITATYRGASCTISFTVVEPENETAVKIAEWGEYLPGQQGVGMLLRVTVHPTDVSFAKVFHREVPGTFSTRSGYFLERVPAEDLYHKTADWKPLDAANEINDTARCQDATPPWYAGDVVWVVPIEWCVYKVDGYVGSLPSRTMEFSIENTAGTTTVRKLGQSATRTP